MKLASVFTERLPKMPESYYALSVASTGNNNARINESMLAIDRALALRPDWPQAVAVKSRLLLCAFGGYREGAADRAAAMSVLERRLPPRRTAANCGTGGAHGVRSGKFRRSAQTLPRAG